MRIPFGVLILYLLSNESNSDTFRRIVGGRDVTLNEFPYVAAWGTLELYEKQKTLNMFCTCSFLSPVWALTASHCVDKHTLHPGVVMYGNIGPGHKAAYTKVLQAIQHPGYFVSDDSAEFILKNDIGLIRTDPVQLLAYALLSAVDHTTMLGHEVYLPGFGFTNDTREVNDVVSLNKTLQVYRGMISTCTADDPFLISRLCVSAPCTHVAMICGGDSGGPAVHASGIVGVNSMLLVGCESYHQFKTIHKHSLAQASSAVLQAASPAADWLYATMKSKD